MTQITLTVEQAQLLSDSEGLVLVYLPDGKSAGTLDRTIVVETPTECTFSEDEIQRALADAATPGPRRTTAEVWARIRSRYPS